MEKEIKLNEKKEEKKIGFIPSKDLSNDDIAKLPKCLVKIVKSKSKKSKQTYYSLKLAIFKDDLRAVRLVVVKNISEVLAMIIAKRRKKDFVRDEEFLIECPIRYSKGKRPGDDENNEYYAFEIFMCEGKRLFDFFSADEIDYLNDYDFKLPFEDRVYFDEDGYKYESVDF